MTAQTKNILLGQCFTLLAAAIVIPVYWSYRMRTLAGFKPDFCVAAIVAGIGATACLAGAMVYLNKPLEDGTPLSHPLRVALKTERRLLAVLQLASTALALGPAAALVFGLPIPTFI